MASSGWLLKDSNSVGGGSSGCCYLGKEEIHKSRKAAVAGVKSAAAMKAREVNLEDFGDSEAAGKGAALAFWVYQRVKKETIEQVEVVDSVGWEDGLVLGNSQNLQVREAYFRTPI